MDKKCASAAATTSGAGGFPTPPRSSSATESLASSSGISSSSSPLAAVSPRLLLRLAALRTNFSVEAKYALFSLLTAILRLDFWRDDYEETKKFCHRTFDVLAASPVFGLPPKSIVPLKNELESGELIAELAELITTVRRHVETGQHSVVDEKELDEMGALLLVSLVQAFLDDGDYDSRRRVLLRHTAALLAVDWDVFEALEDDLAAIYAAHPHHDNYEESESAREAREKSARRRRVKRLALIGAAGSVGGILVGVTGGLAAPVVATGVSALLSGTAAGALIGTVGVTGTAAAVFGGALGLTGAGVTGVRMKRRVGAVDEFEIQRLRSPQLDDEDFEDGLSMKIDEARALHCTLVVSGWVDKDVETSSPLAFHRHWRRMRHSREQYTLRYESRYLAELGNALDYLMSCAVSAAVQQALLETALHAVVSAVALPVAVLSAASVLDNPWSVCCSRATEVGSQLAELLLTRSHGRRPITLIGFSLGARVVFHCLLEMAKREDAYGVVEDVILLGTPVTASAKQWSRICRVVGGRVVNGYCDSDWLLRFLYRTMSAQFTIAGTSAVTAEGAMNLHNFNLSHIVKGHLDYGKKLGEVLAAVGVRVAPVDEDEPDALATCEEAKEAALLDDDVEDDDATLTSTAADDIVVQRVRDLCDDPRQYTADELYRFEQMDGVLAAKATGKKGKAIKKSTQ